MRELVVYRHGVEACVASVDREATGELFDSLTTAFNVAERVMNDSAFFAMFLL